MQYDLSRPARFVQIAAVAVMVACLAMAVGAWILLSQLNQRWQELVDTTDDGLERVEGVLTATTDLAAETANGLESVNGAVQTGGTLTDQTSDLVASVQEVLLPLIDNVDSFAASLEDLALFVEQNDALALFGLQPSLNSSELADLRRDLAQLQTDLDQLDTEQGLAADVENVSSSLDAVVVELRLTEAEYAPSAERVAVARQGLALMRDDMTSVIWWTRGLVLLFLLAIALSQAALYALGGCAARWPPRFQYRDAGGGHYDRGRSADLTAAVHNPSIWGRFAGRWPDRSCCPNHLPGPTHHAPHRALRRNKHHA